MIAMRRLTSKITTKRQTKAGNITTNAVSINGIFGFKQRYYGTKGDIFDYRGILIFWLIIL